MRIVLIFWFGLCTADAQQEDIPTYYMHDLCGEIISLRRESVFTAKIELLPSAITQKQVNPKSDHGSNNMAHCTLSIESWSFQNRLMVHFEEVTLDKDRECNVPSLELLDGPTEFSPRVTAYPSSCELADNLMSRSFVTTDRHMTIRFHGNSTSSRNAVFRAVIVSFNGGTCRSYEHQCFNDRCIMSDLVCNGHNPCGDNSDCPTTVPVPQKIVEKKDQFMLAVVVAATVTSVILIITGVVLCRCYQIRRKHRRLHHQNQYDIVQNNAVRIEEQAYRPQPAYERTVSQIEAERRYAPPSYSQLPVLEDQMEVEEDEILDEPEEIPPNEINFEKCLKPDEKNPPSYACVMLCQDAFNVSESNIHALTTDKTEHTVTADVVMEPKLDIPDTPKTDI